MDLLRRYGLDAESDLPVDPERVLRKLGIPVILRPGLRQEHGVVGFLCRFGKKFQVVIDERHYDREEESSRFTLGEELGHFILHSEGLEDVEDVEDWLRVVARDFQPESHVHSQACLFASNVLLPHVPFGEFCVTWAGKQLKSLARLGNFTREDLAFNMALSMSDDLRVSQRVLEIAINRWPDRPIDSVVRKYPVLMGKRLKGE